MVRPVTFFWLAHAVAFIVICREWIAYFRAAAHIRAVARSEGKDWPFTKDPKYQALFVYSPQSLLEPDDSPNLRDAKNELLTLRARMWRVVITAIAISASGVVLAVAWSITSRFLYDR
jgi:hypothetical protein